METTSWVDRRKWAISLITEPAFFFSSSVLPGKNNIKKAYFFRLMYNYCILISKEKDVGISFEIEDIHILHT